MIAKPGLSIAFSGIGTEVNYDHKLLLKVALYLRKYGSRHLRLTSIDSLESCITNFVSSNYYLISAKMFSLSIIESYAEQISPGEADSFFSALALSELFVAPSETTVFPLVPVRVSENFDATPFFLVAPDGLSGALGPLSIQGALAPTSFPPVSMWDGKRSAPSSWLGIRAPTLDVALQIRAAVLGAIALLPHPFERYTFSGRAMFGGRTTFAKGYSLSFTEPHTPPLVSDIGIDLDDHRWLALLADKITSIQKAEKRQIRALEYYYRAWTPDPVKRFPILFAALDAIFGDAAAATQAVVDAVEPVMGPDYSYARIRLMLGLRASVVHGGAPNVYESSKYEEYYETYGSDATRDLELIAARCLQAVIFPNALFEREHTYRDLIQRETGRSV